jgi:uncharacterized membrane protein
MRIQKGGSPKRLLVVLASHDRLGDVKLFFLDCVVVAGVFGVFAAESSLFVTPALIALTAVVLARGNDSVD